MIHSTNLSKTFQSYIKEPGFKGSLKAIFSRNYVYKDAVKNFNIESKRGEIIGLLGPNGAGKTTLMKMFTGIIVPSRGDLTVMGYKPWERSKEFRKKIALVMGQKSQLWWDIPAMDSFLLLQKYYEIPDDKFKKRVMEMSDILQVEPLLKVHVRKLSLGERMKMELMASLLHTPEIIFLDEPTIGLDLVAQENIREFISEYHRTHNATIFLTSHYMADIQALCKRLVLIFNGEKHYDGPIKEFENILGKDKVVSFYFSEAQNPNDPLWMRLEPKWNDFLDQVELKIPESDLRETTQKILDHKSIIDFHTENMPIERVMKTLMANPDILKA
ncbi:MAG: multidrug ABC transporter ATP-binding protein [Epsilonproteobacteria bacterium]|nr:MAG: multidrug ABC transporter ATP-binding protein [Campylobacterota bacterium]RLA64418.1 MAG: multidrug ABC transporter ATP-binding protein [Campylobacterota bacterium]